MPEICRFFGIIISMFHNDHNPPHFHAKYGSYKMTINISDFSILDGYLPPRVFGFVMEWASIHKEELLLNWEAARKEKPLKKINPLE